jgi:hypothetical protein
MSLHVDLGPFVFKGNTLGFNQRVAFELVSSPRPRIEARAIGLTPDHKIVVSTADLQPSQKYHCFDETEFIWFQRIE